MPAKKKKSTKKKSAKKVTKTPGKGASIFAIVRDCVLKAPEATNQELKAMAAKKLAGRTNTTFEKHFATMTRNIRSALVKKGLLREEDTTYKIDKTMAGIGAPAAKKKTSKKKTKGAPAGKKKSAKRAKKKTG